MHSNLIFGPGLLLTILHQRNFIYLYPWKEGRPWWRHSEHYLEEDNQDGSSSERILSPWSLSYKSVQIQANLKHLQKGKVRAEKIGKMSADLYQLYFVTLLDVFHNSCLIGKLLYVEGETVPSIRIIIFLNYQINSMKICCVISLLKLLKIARWDNMASRVVFSSSKIKTKKDNPIKAWRVIVWSFINIFAELFLAIL